MPENEGTKVLTSAEYEILWGHIEYLQADNAALWDALTKLEESIKSLGEAAGFTWQAPA